MDVIPGHARISEFGLEGTIDSRDVIEQPHVDLAVADRVTPLHVNVDRVDFNIGNTCDVSLIDQPAS